MNRQTNRHMQQREHEHRAAPTVRADEPRAERNEHGAGKSTEKSERDNRAAKILRITADQHRERRLIQGARHRRAEAHPRGVELPLRLHETHQYEARARDERARAHDRARTTGVNRATDKIREHAFHQKRETERERSIDAGEREVFLKMREQQRKCVEQRAPTDQLRDRQPEHETARRMHRLRRDSLTFTARMGAGWMILRHVEMLSAFACMRRSIGARAKYGCISTCVEMAC